MFTNRSLGGCRRSLCRLLWLTLVLVPANVCPGQGAGYWHTSGNRILDANNKQVRITGINWYGFETPSQTVNGLYAQDYKAILQSLKAGGFNTVRIPLSTQMIESPSTNLNIAYSNHAGAINADLHGLNAMQVLDSIVGYAGQVGLKVILDHHRSEAGSSAESGGLWYTATYPESAWTADWTALADRYLGNAAVIGFDLHNEPHAVGNGGACWDCGGANDWHLAAERAGNAVLAVNPKLLIFVEGTDVYNGDSYWWGGNLEGVARSPVVLNVPGHLVYSAHDYGPSESKQTWFNGGTSLASLISIWNRHWGYISQENIAPVWLGEFGSTNDAEDLQSDAAGSEGQWFSSLIEYLRVNTNLNWSYWAVNGEDRYGYLDDTYSGAASAAKSSMLASISQPLKTVTGTPAPPANLTAKPSSSTGVNLGWTVIAGSGLTFAIFFGTHSTNTEAVPANNVSATGTQATSLKTGTNPSNKVKAVSQATASAELNADVAKLAALTPPPVPPKSVVAAASATQAYVAWSRIEADGATYTISVGTSPDSVMNTVAEGLAGTSYLVADLNPGTVYYFQVKAVVNGVSSVPSLTASAITKVLAGLAPPSDLTASTSASGVELSWTASRTTLAKYNVYTGKASAGGGTLLASGLRATTYKASALTAGETHSFTVKAVIGKLLSAESNEVSVTLPDTYPKGATAGSSYLKQLGGRLYGKSDC